MNWKSDLSAGVCSGDPNIKDTALAIHRYNKLLAQTADNTLKQKCCNILIKKHVFAASEFIQRVLVDIANQ